MHVFVITYVLVLCCTVDVESANAPAKLLFPKLVNVNYSLVEECC